MADQYDVYAHNVERAQKILAFVGLGVSMLYFVAKLGTIGIDGVRVERLAISWFFVTFSLALLSGFSAAVIGRLLFGRSPREIQFAGGSIYSEMSRVLRSETGSKKIACQLFSGLSVLFAFSVFTGFGVLPFLILTILVK